MASIVILGAGLSGLSTAYHLEKNHFFDYVIFEKEYVEGGLCRSENVDGFTFDYTGHLIHINDSYFREFLESILSLNEMNLINRRSFIYSHGVYTDYPFQTNLNGLPIDVICECIEGFLQRKNNKKYPKNFYEWVLKYFGPGIGKHFLFPYNKKLWNCDLKKMDHSWTGRFVPSTNLRSIIEGAISKTSKGIGYNSCFYYPKLGGIQAFPSAIARKLKNKIFKGFKVSSIDIKRKLLHFENGHSENYDILISSLPLNKFLKISQEPSNINFSAPLKNLKCNSLINFNLGVDIPNLSDKHWIYLPEKKYPFYRLGFWNNFASSMAKEGCSSFYGEITYLPYRYTKRQLDNLTEKSINKTLELFGLNKSNLVTTKILNIDHAYVIYDEWRDKNLDKILDLLVSNSIYSIGRFGAWKYSSMQEAILDGKQAAELTLKDIKFIGASKTSFQDDDKKIIPAHKDMHINLNRLREEEKKKEI